MGALDKIIGMLGEDGIMKAAQHQQAQIASIEAKLDSIIEGQKDLKTGLTTLNANLRKVFEHQKTMAGTTRRLADLAGVADDTEKPTLAEQAGGVVITWPAERILTDGHDDNPTAAE